MQSQTNKSIRAVGYIFYFLGAATAFFLLAMSVWGDVETSSFEGLVGADQRLNTLRCPVFITRDETAVISARIDNTTDREVSPLVQARWSQGYATLLQEKRERLDIPPGESRTFQFEITDQDAAYRRMVLARVYQFSNLGLPSRTASCGVVLLPFSGPAGQHIFNGSLAVSVVLILAGLYLLKQPDRVARNRQDSVGKRIRTSFGSLVYLSAYLLIAILVVSTLSDWLVSIGLMLLAVVSVIAVLTYLVSSPQ
jgi:hypothetical protein